MTRAHPETASHGKTAKVQEEIIHAALHRYERLPVFEVIMARMAQALGPALRAALHTKVEVSLHAVEYLACGEALDQAPAPGLVAVVTAKPWSGVLAVTLEPALLFAALEVMLGAPDDGKVGAETKPGSTLTTWQPRAFTSIEKRLGGTLIGLVMHELATAFAPVDAVTFETGPIESGPHDIMLAPTASGCVRVMFGVNLDGCSGKLCLIVPHRTLDGLRTTLSKPCASGQLDEDPGWGALLSQSLNDTPVTLTAILHEHMLPLADVLDWQRGQVLDLGIDAAQDITVAVSGKDMFRAAIGRRKNGAVALRVTAQLDRKQKEGAYGPDN
ncbi:flagellar motor switch protein FliM [Roseinatronobacter sp.]|uniref:flagellar motor switch protein FliM n=1 Tax=Roseinatronobacter sp. TaxID=1945755 RepID=UPI003F701F19